MFERIKTDARLRPDDVSKLLDVNRVTVSQWFNGHSKPHRLLSTRVERLLRVIDAAIEAGDLPVPYNISRRERAYYIRTVVEKHLKEMVNPPGDSNAE